MCKARSSFESEAWEPSISAARYAEMFEQVQELIRNGDTYQVNVT